MAAKNYFKPTKENSRKQLMIVPNRHVVEEVRHQGLHDEWFLIPFGERLCGRGFDDIVIIPGNVYNGCGPEKATELIHEYRTRIINFDDGKFLVM